LSRFFKIGRRAPAMIQGHGGITMHERVMRVGLTLTTLALCAGVAHGAGRPRQKATTMIARGTFDVKVMPQPQDEAAGGPFGRFFLDKQFHGDLEGTSKGQMLAAGTGVEQSGAYVALELVTGTVLGRRGSFILQHTGTMQKGVYALEVKIVPDSGTDQLTGLSGAMTIRIVGRDHSYELEYTLKNE
jgi:hypothetical protein